MKIFLNVRWQVAGSETYMNPIFSEMYDHIVIIICPSQFANASKFKKSSLKFPLELKIICIITILTHPCFQPLTLTTYFTWKFIINNSSTKNRHLLIIKPVNNNLSKSFKIHMSLIFKKSVVKVSKTKNRIIAVQFLLFPLASLNKIISQNKS